MDKNTQFNYLLNAFERASQADLPVDHGYRQKREALIAHVRELERIAKLVAAVHVGPGHVYDFDKLTGAIVAARAIGVPGMSNDQPARPVGCALAMRVLQSDLYRQLDDEERADCDELVRQNLEWFKDDCTSGVLGTSEDRNG